MGNCHILHFSSFTAFIIIIKIMRQWKINVIVFAHINRVGNPGAVRGFMAYNEAKRFGSIAVI